MGNIEICEKCQSLQNIYPQKNTNKSNTTRSISWSGAQLLGKKIVNPKIIKIVERGIYEVIYPTGGVYIGEMLDQTRHGKGKHTWPGGHYYEGMWANDKSHGMGVLKTLAFMFEGHMANNSIVKGKMTVFNKRNEEIYQGQFKDYMYHGEGKLTVNNQFVYIGDFSYHKKNGKGKISFANGHEYEGEFKNGAMNGMGRYQSPEMEYTGEFKNGKIHGEGKCIWKNGTIYSGYYVNGIKEGFGEYRYEDGKIYRGTWKQGKPFELSFTFGKRERQLVS